MPAAFAAWVAAVLRRLLPPELLESPRRDAAHFPIWLAPVPHRYLSGALTSQRGLSGTGSRATRKRIEGIAIAANIHRQLPAPRNASPQPVRLGQQDSQHDSKLIETDEPAPNGFGGNLRNVKRGQKGSDADCDTANKASSGKLPKVARHSGSR